MNTLLKKQLISIILLTIPSALTASDVATKRAALAEVAAAKKIYQEATLLHNAKDYRAALELYEKAAEADNLNACKKLGGIYANGSTFGIEPDFARAFKWFKRAAEFGDISAQTNIGRLYSLGGPGITQNTEKAKMWLRRAAHLGDMDALTLLKAIEE